jgi:hypothetical protein
MAAVIGLASPAVGLPTIESGPSCTEAPPQHCFWKAPAFYHEFAPRDGIPWTDGSPPAPEKPGSVHWGPMLPGPSITDGGTGPGKPEPIHLKPVTPGPSVTDGEAPENDPTTALGSLEPLPMGDHLCTAADINDDHCVDELDVMHILKSWGLGQCPADCNGDGIVDGIDLLAVMAQWGYCV